MMKSCSLYKKEEAGKMGGILPAVMKKVLSLKVIGLFTVINIPENCDGSLTDL